jgi:hypothetical protein
VPVTEVFHGAVVWEGDVKAFDLVRHESALRAYVWSHATTGERRRFVGGAARRAGGVDRGEDSHRLQSALRSPIVAAANAIYRV